MTASNLESSDGAAPRDAEERTIESDAAAPAPSEAPRKPRVSRRIPKSDAVLEAAVDRARLGVLEVAPEAQVGRHVSAAVEGERLVTHRFEAFLPGYGGWQWYASVARVARSKDVTVCEVGLLPSAASLVAPEWLPWSQRVRPEDSQPDEAAAPAAAPREDGPADDTPGGRIEDREAAPADADGTADDGADPTDADS